MSKNRRNAAKMTDQESSEEVDSVVSLGSELPFGSDIGDGGETVSEPAVEETKPNEPETSVTEETPAVEPAAPEPDPVPPPASKPVRKAAILKATPAPVATSIPLTTQRSSRMAISLEKYVDITTTFPKSNTIVRSFGGLVFTTSEMLPTAPTKALYDAGQVVPLDVDGVKVSFGEQSNEYKFAVGYYDYISPSGDFASMLNFRKMATVQNSAEYQVGQDYAKGVCLRKPDDATKDRYLCIKSIAKGALMAFDKVTSDVTEVNVANFDVAAETEADSFVKKGDDIYYCKEGADAGEWDDVKAKFELLGVADYVAGNEYAKWTESYHYLVKSNTKFYKVTDDISVVDYMSWDKVATDCFRKIDPILSYAAHTAYDKDSFIRIGDDGPRYVVSEPITALENTDFDKCRSNLIELDESPRSAFTSTKSKTNQFGSFTFLNSDSRTFGNAELRECAVANEANGNDMYLMVVNGVRGDKTAGEVLNDKAEIGNDLRCTVYVSGATDVSAYMPMAIFAATNYRDGEVTNHMFKQFAGEAPTVMGDAEFEAFVQKAINFYGRTQSNGASIDFYQQGVNCNGNDTAVYCNEIWFKSACATRLIDLLVKTERVPADAYGVSLVTSEVEGICGNAVSNGTFMVKESISDTSRKSISQMVLKAGGDASVVDSIVTGITTNGYYVWGFLDPNAKYVHYYVFYGTADSVKFIKGEDVMVA